MKVAAFQIVRTILFPSMFFVVSLVFSFKMKKYKIRSLIFLLKFIQNRFTGCKFLYFHRCPYLWNDSPSISFRVPFISVHFLLFSVSGSPIGLALQTLESLKIRRRQLRASSQASKEAPRNTRPCVCILHSVLFARRLRVLSAIFVCSMEETNGLRHLWAFDRIRHFIASFGLYAMCGRSQSILAAHWRFFLVMCMTICAIMSCGFFTVCERSWKVSLLDAPPPSASAGASALHCATPTLVASSFLRPFWTALGVRLRRSTKDRESELERERDRDREWSRCVRGPRSGVWALLSST